MASVAGRLLRRSSSLIAPYKSIAMPHSSSTASLVLYRLSLSSSASAQLPLSQFLYGPPFQSLAFSSAASAEDSDGDTIAAPELSIPVEEYASPLCPATPSVDLHQHTGASPDASPLAEEPSEALGRESTRTQEIPMKKGDWICSQCNFMNFARNFRCLECKTLRTTADGGRFDQVEVKKGDWTCSQCGFMNFFKNIRCLQCKADKSASDFANVVLRKGDWHCPECKFMNFAKNVNCLQCNAARPLKPGDWTCPRCQFMNFARNTVCRRCQEVRPENAGFTDWECPSCKFLNFERNTACLKCNFERPMENSWLGLPREEYSSRKATNQSRESLLFDDRLFGSNENDASSEDDKRS